MNDLHLGEFEELVLLAVGGLGDEAYAVAVQQRIEQRTGRAATMGAVYTALDRLEEKGALASWLGEVTHERGGRRKRFYRITGTGTAALVAMRQARERLWEGLELKPSLGLE
jgi:PadR family transcriptional regulator PadR